MDPTIITAIAFAILLLICLILGLQLFSLKKQLRQVTSGIDEKNLIEIIQQYIRTLNQCHEDMDVMNQEFQKIRQDTADFFRKVGLVRYQGFKDTGGDQSFSLCLLNQKDDGIMITSLFGRDFSKIFAKKIKGGAPAQHNLTDEEESALKEALEQ